MKRIRNIKFEPTAAFTQALLHEYLDYNRETGWLTWKKKPARRTGIGDRAGSTDKSTSGYRRIHFLDHHLLEHRVIWFYVYGVWPGRAEIDHINRVRDDNRFANLRIGSVGQNRVNRLQRNLLGIKNVYKTKKGRFVVYVCLGTYDTKIEAAQVAYDAGKKLHGDFVTPEMYGLQKTELTSHGDTTWLPTATEGVSIPGSINW